MDQTNAKQLKTLAKKALDKMREEGDSFSAPPERLVPPVLEGVIRYDLAALRRRADDDASPG